MAFAVWLKSVPGRDASEYWMVDAVPWPARRLIDDPRFRPMDTDGTEYADYLAVLSVAEGKAINETTLSSSLPLLEAIAAKVQSRLENDTPSGLVVVCIYEWESGLGD